MKRGSSGPLRSASGNRAPQPARAKSLSPRGWQLLGVVLLAGAVFLTYRGAIGGPLIFDDGETIVHNSSIRHLWPLWTAGGGYSPLHAPPETPVHGRPVVNLTLAVNYHFSQLDPRGYHVTNIVLHILAALVLWAVARRTLELVGGGQKFGTDAQPLAFSAAALWALHPLVTESVAYVTQRSEELMALFYLATLYASQRYWAATSRRDRALWVAAAVAACQAGMLSKEAMASAPVIVLLYERTFVAGSFRRALAASWPLYLGLAATWIPLALLNLPRPATPMAGFNLGVTGPEWWLTQTKALCLYVKLAVWPWPLVISYEWPLSDSLAAAWPYVVLALLLALATALLVWRNSAAGFAGALFFAVLSPTFVFPIPTEVAAERRMYLPLAPLVVLAVAVAYMLMQQVIAWTHRHGKRLQTSPLALTLGAAAFVATGYALASAQRLTAFETELALWQDTVSHSPDNVTAQINLGTVLSKSGQPEEAIPWFRRAIENKPDLFLGHYSLAQALESVGEFEEAEKEFSEAARLRPDFAAARYQQGRMLERAGQLAEAKQKYEEALERYPDFPMAHFALACLLDKEGQTEQARAHYEEALRLEPQYAAAHRNLGILLGRAGQPREAVGHFELVVRLAPSVDAYSNLALAYSQTDRPVEALSMAQRGIQFARSQGKPAEAERLQKWAQAYQRAVSQPSRAPRPSDRAEP